MQFGLLSLLVSVVVLFNFWGSDLLQSGGRWQVAGDYRLPLELEPSEPSSLVDDRRRLVVIGTAPTVLQPPSAD